MASLADTITELETRLEELVNENASLKQANVLTEQEVKAMQKRIADLMEENSKQISELRDENTRQVRENEALHTLINSSAALIVEGMRKIDINKSRTKDLEARITSQS